MTTRVQSRMLLRIGLARYQHELQRLPTTLTVWGATVRMKMKGKSGQEVDRRNGGKDAPLKRTWRGLLTIKACTLQRDPTGVTRA